MESGSQIKQVVREKYAKIAERAGNEGCCGPSEVNCFSDDYTQLSGYAPEADLGLGCGIPTAIARIKQGDTVLDLGSGAGNDAFVARSLVGEAGKVIGVDMTESMIAKATTNASKLGYRNVEFRLGDIEGLPVDADSVDIVISNCVLNLVPDKREAFSEIWRVLKPDGHFSISDIVVLGELPQKLRKSAEAYVGCVAGAMGKDEYLSVIKQSGFTNVVIAKEKPLPIPDELIRQALSAEELDSLNGVNYQLMSITVYGEKHS
jgi:arsenite methyltransferase